MCNGVYPKEIIQTNGFYGALPTRMLKTSFEFTEDNFACPVTYITLNEDKIFSSSEQSKMAGRIPNVDLVDLKGCHQSIIYQADTVAKLLAKYA
mgnify:CR=1 FL=1